MSEKLDRNQHVEPEKPPGELAQEYFDYYLEQIGAPELETISAYDKRIMADVPLMVQLEPLSLPGTLPSPETDPKGHERYVRVKYFQENNWLPMTEREATIASNLGLDETISRASRTKNGLPGKALVDTHSSVKGFHARAAESYGALTGVRTPTESLEIHPDIDKLRSNKDALYVIADALMAREFLNRNDWRTGRENRQRYWRGFTLFAAENATDEVLADIFDDVLAKERNSRDYWSPKLEIANQKIGHLVVGEEQAVGDKDNDEGLTQIPDSGIDSFEELLPEDIRDALRIRRAEFEAEFDRLQPLGMPEHVKLAILKRKFPEFYPLDDVEENDMPQRPQGTKSRRKNTRQGLGPGQLLRADEPPPGVDDARRTY